MQLSEIYKYFLAQQEDQTRLHYHLVVVDDDDGREVGGGGGGGGEGVCVGVGWGQCSGVCGL